MTIYINLFIKDIYIIFLINISLFDNEKSRILIHNVLYYIYNTVVDATFYKIYGQKNKSEYVFAFTLIFIFNSVYHIENLILRDLSI